MSNKKHSEPPKKGEVTETIEAKVTILKFTFETTNPLPHSNILVSFVTFVTELFRWILTRKAFQDNEVLSNIYETCLDFSLLSYYEKEKSLYLKMNFMWLKKQKLLLNSFLLLYFFQLCNQIYCQKFERNQTIFTSDAKFGYIFSPGIKFNSVFNKITTEIDLYGGLLINEKIVIGAAGGVNAGYPQIDYGYIGIIGQYIFKPANFIHYSWQTILCYGSLSVNDMGVSGSEKSVTRFYLMEPGINIEINLMRTLRLVTGVSYRFVPEVSDQSLNDPFFTSRDLRGMSLRIGLITGSLLEVLK